MDYSRMMDWIDLGVDVSMIIASAIWLVMIGRVNSRAAASHKPLSRSWCFLTITLCLILLLVSLASGVAILKIGPLAYVLWLALAFIFVAQATGIVHHAIAFRPTQPIASDPALRPESGIRLGARAKVLVVFREMMVLLDRWHWLWLGLAIPFLLFPSPERSAALLVVPGLWVVAWLANEEPAPLTPLNVPLLLLTLMVQVSLFASYDVVTSLPKISGMILGIGVFYTCVRLGDNSRRWWALLLVFLVFGAGISALGLVGINWVSKVVFFMPVLSRLPYRLVVLPGAEAGLSPNEVAGALLWVIPVCVLLCGFVLTRVKDVQAALGRSLTTSLILLLLGMSLLVVSVFVLTQSRGGYIAFGLTALLLAVILLPRSIRWFFLGGVVMLACIAVAVMWQARTGVAWRDLFDGSSAGDPAMVINTFEARLEIWSRALYGIQDFPFTGMGMNTFRRIVQVLYPTFLISSGQDIAHAHNEFLQAALDLGIPGLVAFVALYIGAFAVIRDAWQGVTDHRRFPSLALPSQPLTRILALGLGGGMIAHLLYGLTDAVALGAKPGILFWMLLGLVVRLSGRDIPAMAVSTNTVGRKLGTRV